MVDASLFVGWLLNEPGARANELVWDKLSSETLFVPTHWPNEIANALRRAVRTRRLNVDEIVPIAQRVAVFDIELAAPTPVETIGALAADALRHQLSVYDLLYVQLAREHRLPLATIDQPMRAVAGKLGVAVLPA